jgi:type II secretory pathway component PulJ
MSCKTTKPKSIAQQSGQSIIEVLIALAIGAIFIGAAVAVIVVALRISSQNEFAQKATELNQELSEQVAIVAKDSWHNIDGLSLGSSTQYYLSESSGFFAVNSGKEIVLIDAVSYSRWFSIEEVERDNNNQIVESAGTVDPSTYKITLYTEWTQNTDTAQTSMTRFIVRNGNQVTEQSDWVMGAGEEGPVTDPASSFSSSTNIHYASTGQIIISNFQGVGASSTGNIDPTNKWGWNDVIGWLDMRFYETVIVSSTIIQGYASSSVDEIAFDCATSPSADCSASYSVLNDGNGILSGWAWNENIGWLSFNCSDLAICGVSNYAVTIDPDTGDFSGWAWNDIIGWVSFNCSNTSSCGTVNYKVNTSWGNSVIEGNLISSIIDTEISGGAALNTVMWQGSQPAGTAVRFQISSSNSSSGPWLYIGSDGTNSSYYQPAGPDIQSRLSRNDFNNKRYFRYKVFLDSNASKTQTPTVNSIIVSWSP